MIELHARERVIEVALRMNHTGLSLGRSGNVSERFGEGFLITPTGMLYEDLNTDDIVFVRPDGTFKGNRAPSSEWQFHQEIYRANENADAIVHVHSRHATALACARRTIPAFHYMVAVAGGKTIELAEYATFGTRRLAHNIVKTLGKNRACLMANHGQIAIGANAHAAFELAQEIEELSAQYCLVLQLGNPVILPDSEMNRVTEKFKSYGQNANPSSTAQD